MSSRISERRIDRRRVLAGAGGAVAAIAAARIVVVPALATPEQVQEEVKRLLGGREPKPGKVSLTLPPIAEDGSSVPLKVAVDSPMSEADHIKAIHILAEQNPIPHVVTFRLTPRSGKAEVEIRIRLAKSQTVLAVAEASDGSVWSGTFNIRVTIGGCAS